MSLSVREGLHLSTVHCSCLGVLVGVQTTPWCLAGRQPSILASLSTHNRLLSPWWSLLCLAVVRQYLAAFKFSWHSPEFHLPIFYFYHLRCLVTASLVFCQELAWLLTVVNGHRGAGAEFSLSWEGRWLVCWYDLFDMLSNQILLPSSLCLSLAFWEHKLSPLPYLPA